MPRLVPAACASPLLGRICPNAPPAPQLRPASGVPGCRPQLLTAGGPRPAPSHALPDGPPPRPSRDSHALRAHGDWQAWPRGWDLADSPAPQRDCRFQTSPGSGHGLRCGRWEPPHKRPGHNCRPLSGREKWVLATLGATRRLTGLQLENASCRGQRRGAGREPPWRGRPRENLLRPER